MEGVPAHGPWVPVAPRERLLVQWVARRSWALVVKVEKMQDTW